MVSVPMNRITTMMPSTGFTTKYEEYAASNQDTTRGIWGVNWAAQLFTPAAGHTLNGVKLALFRTGNPGQTTVSIQALSGGDPDGTDLSLATIEEARLDVTSAVIEVSMPAVLLTVSVQYAIVVRALSAPDGSNQVEWDEDSSTPTYAGGNLETSGNSGSTWSAQSGVDEIFEEWGFA